MRIGIPSDGLPGDSPVEHDQFPCHTCGVQAVSLRATSRSFVVALLWGLTATISGCEQTERVLDVEAPGVDIEVDRSTDGEIDVHVDDEPD